MGGVEWAQNQRLQFKPEVCYFWTVRPIKGAPDYRLGAAIGILGCVGSNVSGGAEPRSERHMPSPYAHLNLPMR